MPSSAGQLGRELIVVSSLDRLDAQLLALLEDDPRTGVVDLAERLGTSRNTVQARLTRLRDTGLLRGFRVSVDFEAVGVPVTGLVSIDLSQGSLADAVAALTAIPYVLEVLTCTGDADLVVRIVAESHAQLQDLIQDLLSVPGVVRTTTVIVLTTPVAYRVQPLLLHLTRGTGRGRAKS